MGLFTKNEEAKARRTQEREEQQKKAKAVPPPYVHTPTHALKDSLLSVPNAYKGTDKQRLKRAHQQRLEKEASALAAGSDTNVTNIPAKYWQGQPLPAQFKAPTPASLHELASSKPSLKGKKIKLPVNATAHKQPRASVDEGYASGHDQNNTAKPSREPAKSVKGPSHKLETKQSQQVQAAEADREAELKRLRRRVRELEGKRRVQNEPISNSPIRTAPTSAPMSNFSRKPNFGSKTSSSDSLEGLSSVWSNQVDSLTPPSSPSTTNKDDGVNRYDWAIHWARINAATEEERSRLPSAINPIQRLAPMPKDLPCYASLDEFDRIHASAPASEPSSNSSVHRNTKTLRGPGSVSADSSATLVGSEPADDRTNPMEKPSYKYMHDWDFGLAAATPPNMPGRGNYPSSRHRSQANRAEARCKNHDGNDSPDENLISFI